MTSRPHTTRWALALGLLLSMTAGVQAATYTRVDTSQSRVTFRFQQMGVSMDGQFKKFVAQANLNTAQPAKATGRLDIDLASIDTGSSEADQEVVGKAWFHVAAHPKGIFVLQSFKPLGGDQYEVVGQLTLKGITRPVRVPARLTPQGVLSGSAAIKRGDFSIGEGMWAKFDVVANDITVLFSLQLK